MLQRSQLSYTGCSLSRNQTTANGGPHCCRPPLYVHSVSRTDALGSGYSTLLTIAGGAVVSPLPANGSYRFRPEGCRSGRIAPGLLPIRAFAQGRAAILRSFFRPDGCEHLPAASLSGVCLVFLRTTGERRSGRCLPSRLPLPDTLARCPDEFPRGKAWRAGSAISLVPCAGWRPKSLPRHSLRKVLSTPRSPITKATVSHIRRSARRHLPVGYAANYPCSCRFALFLRNSRVWALNSEALCVLDTQKLRLLPESRKQKVRELSTAPAPFGG